MPEGYLRERLKTLKSPDVPWKSGKVFGFVYHPGDEYTRIGEAFYRAFYYENMNNPTTFPSLMNFEKDLVRMAKGLMHGGKNVAGHMTTGGTESIFLSIKVARDLAREEHPERFSPGKNIPEVILPRTVHPASLKACHYLNLKPVMVPVREDKTADPAAIAGSVNENTILLVCSAPCFPYGVIDPVAEIAKIARTRRLLLHVDACMGGFMLPFLEELGYPIPPFDFRVPGVTSISMDAHKYGYAPKGTSVILYRDRRLRRKQFFIDTEWPGGIFASTTFMGTKCGGPLAGAWAIMHHLGREGYRELAGSTMKCAVRIREGIDSIDGLSIIGDPQMTVMAFTSEQGDIFNIGEELGRRGWYLDRLQFPDALHLTVNRLNVGMEEELLKDLKEIVEEQRILQISARSTKTSVRLVGGLSGLLPASVFNTLVRMAGKFMGRSASETPRKTASGVQKPAPRSSGTQAALYGLHASLKNRRNVIKLVENLLDGMFS